MEENTLSSQSSDIQIITDLEQHAEKVFKWALDGLQMQGHLTKGTAGQVKRVMLETFEKYESKWEPKLRKFLPNLEDNNSLSVSEETKDENRENKDGINESALHKQLEDSCNSNLQQTEDITEMNDVNDEYRNILSRDLEEGEISCSTENTGEIDENIGEMNEKTGELNENSGEINEDGEDVVHNVNSIMNALRAQESPSIIKNYLRSTLKINTVEDVRPFVDKAFQECLQNMKFSKTFVELVHVISEHTGGEIASALKIAAWKKCITIFEGKVQSESVVLGFSYSEERNDIKKAESIFKTNYEETSKKDNITGLIVLLFQKELLDLHHFATFVFKLLTLATTECNSYFRYLCSLLAAVGEQFEKELLQDEYLEIELTIAKGIWWTYPQLMDVLYKEMQEYTQKNRSMHKQLVERINGLLHLRRNGWMIKTENSPSSSSDNKILHSATVPDCNNDLGPSTSNQKQIKSKTSRPHDLIERKNQRKFNHQYKNYPRNINRNPNHSNQRYKSRQDEQQFRKIKEIVMATNDGRQLKPQQLLALQQLNAQVGSNVTGNNFVVPPPSVPVPQRNVANSYTDNRARARPQYKSQGQNTSVSVNRGRQNQNYRAENLPYKGQPRNQNNSRRNKRVYNKWLRQEAVAKSKNIPGASPGN